MIWALVIGAGTGLGLVSAAWAIVPPRTDLVVAAVRFDTAREYARTASRTEAVTWQERVGHTLAAAVANRGLGMVTLRANLALMDRTLEQHLVTKLLTGMIGLALPGVAAAVLAQAGLGVDWTITVGVGIAFAAGFSFLPDLSVAGAAQARRDELRRALACYLDLVSMALAGGRGVPEALPSAARIGQGWAFELIADTLKYARYRGITPWEALGQLGQRVDVSELRDLGNALSLVSEDGARIKESLRARAATARSRQLSEAEGNAEKASESIKNAHLMLGFSFLLFLGFPAVVAVMAV